MGVCNEGVRENRDFQLISRFISEMIQDTAAVMYGMRIGHRAQAFEWYHFQWPLTTPNPDFKVTSLWKSLFTRNGSNKNKKRNKNLTKLTKN